MTPAISIRNGARAKPANSAQSAKQTGGVGGRQQVARVQGDQDAGRHAGGAAADMKDVLGYEFFTVKDGAPLELDPAYGPEYAQAYNRRSQSWRGTLRKLLKTLEVEGEAGGDRQGRRTSAAPSKPVVYLAECSYDRKQAREHHRRGAEAPRLPGAAGQAVAGGRGGIRRGRGEPAGALRALDPSGRGELRRRARRSDDEVGRSCSRTSWPSRAADGGLKRLIWLPQGTAPSMRSAGVHRRAAPGRGSPVRRGPDRGRHRGTQEPRSTPP